VWCGNVFSGGETICIYCLAPRQKADAKTVEIELLKAELKQKNEIIKQLKELVELLEEQAKK
jgi:cell division protein FtsB